MKKAASPSSQLLPDGWVKETDAPSGRTWYVDTKNNNRIHKHLPNHEDDDLAPRHYKVSPELTANFLSRYTFWFYNYLVSLAQRRTLVDADLYPLIPEDVCENVVDSFITHWNNEVSRVRQLNAAAAAAAPSTSALAKKKTNPNLLRVYYNMSPTYFIISAVMEFILRAALLGGPLILQELIKFLPDNTRDDSEGYGYAALLFLCGVVAGLATSREYSVLVRVGVHMQAAITGGVYRKSLRLSAKSRLKMGGGTVLNLIGQDTQRIFYLLQYIHIIWSGPTQFAVIFVLMSRLIGVEATLPAFGVLLACLVFMQYANNNIQLLEKERMKVSDTRVKMVNEVLQGIRAVKLYGWEESFSARIQNVRKEELRIIFRIAVFRAMLFASFLLTPMLMAVVAFYTLVSNDSSQLTPLTIFGTIALINIVRQPLLLFPMLMANWASAKVSFKRIRSFYMLKDAPPLATTTNNTNGADGDDDDGKKLPRRSLVLKDASFAWPSLVSETTASTPPPRLTSTRSVELTTIKQRTGPVTTRALDTPPDTGGGGGGGDDDDDHEFAYGFKLSHLDFVAKPGELVEIVGVVGGGKTSFMRALIGDMEELDSVTGTWMRDHKSSSNVYVNGSIAYVPQQPWIRNITFRENITFGRPYNKKRYEQVLEMCALIHDRDTLTYGDDTEIGEKGINLSGGQKQRVALARAVYSEADIYLFDDTLSAVDAHVGKHIFFKCIMEHLIKKRHRTVIMCTHQVQFLEPADRIYIMADGAFVKSGTFDDLRDDLSDFKQISSGDGDDANNADAESQPPSLERERSESTSMMSERKNSTASETKQQQQQQEQQNFTTKHHVDEGVVPVTVYTFYGKMAGGYWFVGILLSFYVISQSFLLLTDWWLSTWVRDLFHHNNEYYMTYYGWLAAATGVTAFVRIYMYSWGAQRASSNIHQQLLQRVTEATMTYFDQTPLGRVVDHFSKDQLYIDQYIPMMFDQYGTLLLSVVGSLIFIAVITAWFIIPLVIVALAFVFIQSRFMRTSRSLYRMWLNAHGPVYSFLGETLQGVSTIRAYGVENDYVQLMDQRVNKVNNLFLHSQMLTRWLNLRLDLISAVLSGCTAVIMVLLRNQLPPALSALALTLAINITGLLGMMVLIGAFLETFMTAVQRIQTMWQVVPEKYTGPASVDRLWPMNGEVTFDNIQMRYANGPLVLKGISAKIPPGAKVGVCGRTGAGKTSLTTALFRLVELEAGSIVIDGQNVSEMSLRDLRRGLSIIPQDAVCFEGTMRSNLDPFNEYTESELWSALERVRLKEKVKAMNENNNDTDAGLDVPIEPNGANLSMGERQLVCMARAMLRRSRVLVMDEATASIDNRTDAQLQRMIREEFVDVTVLTIAHRMNTIVDYDYILVLDNGVVAEFGSPKELLEQEGSMFRSLVGESSANDDGDEEDVYKRK